MKLGGLDILKRVDDGSIIINPFNARYLNPNSYDLRLADTLLIYVPGILDVAKEHMVSQIKIPSITGTDAPPWMDCQH